MSGPPTATPRTRATRLHMIGWLCAAVGFSVTVLMRGVIDDDYWWHRALGAIITTRGIPSAEPFSFLTPARPWAGQQWGYEVLLAAAGSVGNAMLIMGAVTMAALVVAVRAVPHDRDISAPLSAAVVMLSALVVAQMAGVRGQMITLLGTALVIWIVTRWRDGSTRVVWLLPPLLVVWVNLHGGFFTGLGIPLVAIAVTAIMRRGHADRSATPLRPLICATLVAAVATLANPAGPGFYPYVWDTAFNPSLTQGIVEWQSPDFHNWLLRLFELEVMVLVALWVVSGRPDPLDVVLGLGAVAAALTSQRNVALFAVVAAPQLAAYGSLVWRTRAPRLRMARRPGVFVAACGVVLAMIGLTVVVPRTDAQATAQAERTAYPADAVTYVAAHFDGRRVFTRYEWGGYLAHRVPRGRVVFLYGESAIFGEANMRRYLTIGTIAAGWQRELAADGMRIAIVPRASPEATALRAVGWTVTFTDTGADALVLTAPR